jgi:hypothetical protein
MEMAGSPPQRHLVTAPTGPCPLAAAAAMVGQLRGGPHHHSHLAYDLADQLVGTRQLLLRRLCAALIMIRTEAVTEIPLHFY